MGINILGMGRYLPEQTITNADFEKCVIVYTRLIKFNYKHYQP